MRTVLHIIVVLALHVQQTVSQQVQCYAQFDPTDGTCGDILGEVPFDDCCMNPAYGYMDESSVCKSCRLASWSPWSQWSSCSVTCTIGVQQRKRSCYGIGKCDDRRLLGNIQTKPCEDIDCCPVNGSWGEWSPWEPCSVTCERGIRKRKRTCSNPPPVCGGICEGNSEETEACDMKIDCPIHGGWSAWGNWGTCTESCVVEGQLPPLQQRQRTCTNPQPSVAPRGNNCPGPSTDNQPCTWLPFCAVNGNWGAWSEASQCSVTCGLGKQTQYRNCDNPAPKHGGQGCLGENSQKILCMIPENCPADGHWNEWNEWSRCEPTSDRPIRCKNKTGNRRRLRDCKGTDYGGKACPGLRIDFGRCYDIDRCKAGPEELIKGAKWSEWSSWSYCKPDCGEDSKQTRKRECEPDMPDHSEVPRDMFIGKPAITCPPLENTEEHKMCLNLPPC